MLRNLSQHFAKTRQLGELLNEVLSLNAQELTTLNALAVLVGASSMKS